MGLSFLLAVICIHNFHHSLAAENANPPADNTLETYIVHLEPNLQTTDLDSFYDSFMANPSTASQAEGPRMIYLYRNVFTGFAAKLSAKDVEAMQQKKGFISAHKEEILQLMTTHTPNFLGLNQNTGFWNASNYGKGVIIGVLDTGITPDHPSFSDEGVPPPPKRWMGKCEFKSGKGCNNKLIGARSVRPGTEPTDGGGHGTHTSATAAGNFVKDANIFGLANGTAAGMAPLAHVAMYKICYEGCAESDMLAGMDAAISDGVDIMSISIGATMARRFSQSSIAVGSYAATQRGIFVSCSAGNSGPGNSTVLNDAPWILTVGASTHDRRLDVAVVLGDNQELLGESAFQPVGSNVSTTKLELAFPNSTTCDSLTDRYDGKVVVCEMGGESVRIVKGQNVKNAGAAAMILVNTEDYGYVTFAEPHVLPAAHISYQDGIKLRSYSKSSAKPVASLLFKGTRIGDKNAPVVAGFSSRGPSVIVPGIFKPDIIGPGVSVIAAWNKPLDPSSKSAAFNTESGTSMSAPHLSGVAALIKSSHPDWSVAAIKSAMITTAQTLNLDKKPILDRNFKEANAFATGSGHVNPSLASDPGLIYDIDPLVYIPFLCGLNYTDEQVGIVVRQPVTCSTLSPITETQLNYPSFSINFGSPPQTYIRTVTNVGEANSTYEVKVESHPSVTITVEPTKLVFTEVGEQLGYNVTFTRSPGSQEKNQYGEGSIIWSSTKHTVRSPVGFVFN